MLSGGASGQTVVPTAPQAVHGWGASLGPAHEEGEVVRMAVVGGRGEDEQRRHGCNSPGRKADRRGGQTNGTKALL
jgi:hypothetical protein